MTYRRKWTPSKSAKREFAEQMNKIDQFCIDNNISASRTKDSYYFTINGQEYRVSNHSVESSNGKAFTDLGQTRELYHPNGREDNVIYIHASKTRIIDIYNDIKNGYILDGKGNRKEKMA